VMQLVKFRFSFSHIIEDLRPFFGIDRFFFRHLASGLVRLFRLMMIVATLR
jgi:hypothetical protein